MRRFATNPPFDAANAICFYPGDKWQLEIAVVEICTAFAGPRRIARGPLASVAPHVKAAYDSGAPELLVFDDATGRLVELDLRGSEAEVLQRVSAPPSTPARGRPRLGVTAREVTLLPSQWEWLASQPGGASGTLRRLVDAARRSATETRREAREAAYRVMSALGGDLPGFEEASRAFFAGDVHGLRGHIEAWPPDIGDYVLDLADRALAPVEPPKSPD